jgi:peptidoglycan hydrolase CwlO-like protein
MKSITRLSLALIMFSLFSISYLVTSVSADMYNPPPNPSNDPRNTMKSESVAMTMQTNNYNKRIEDLEDKLNKETAKSDKFSADLKKQTAQTHKRIDELENQLKEDRSKIDILQGRADANPSYHRVKKPTCAPLLGTYPRCQ